MQNNRKLFTRLYSKNLIVRLLLSSLCLTVMLLVACGESPGPQKVYHFPLVVTDIPTFDPAQATDQDSIAAIDMVFTGLVQFDDNLHVQPQLAESYSLSEDGLTWTFNLRHNLRFSDGTPLTSHDVVYSIDRALSPEISSLNGVSLTYLGLIKDSEKRVANQTPTLINKSLITPDDNTVVILLNRRASYFLQALAYPTSYVVEKSVIDTWGQRWTDHLADRNGQGGNGPFKVANYNHSTGIDFVPNLNYYGPHPRLNRVSFPFIKDKETGYALYQSGQVDQAVIPSAHLDEAKRLTKEFHQVPELWTIYYGMNYLVRPFNNIHIRQAFALAINKDLIVKSAWKNTYLATNHIVPKGMTGYNADLTGPDGTTSTSGNQDEAKRLFEQGLQEEQMTLATFPRIRFTYAQTSQDTANEVATVIEMWQTVLGVNIEPHPVDKTELFTAVANTTGNTNLQLWRVDWIADYPDPQDWLSLQFGKGASNNNVNYGQNQSSDAS